MAALSFSLIKLNLQKYNFIPRDYHSKSVKEIIFNENSHLCSIFKDYLIFEEESDFINNKLSHCLLLQVLTEACRKYSQFSPNYSKLSIGLHMLKNIFKKSKLKSLNRRKKQSKIYSSILTDVTFDSVDVKSIENLLENIYQCQKVHSKVTVTKKNTGLLFPKIVLNKETGVENKNGMIKLKKVKPKKLLNTGETTRETMLYKAILTTRQSDEKIVEKSDLKSKLRKGTLTERKVVSDLLQNEKLETILKKKLKIKVVTKV